MSRRAFAPALVLVVLASALPWNAAAAASCGGGGTREAPDALVLQGDAFTCEDRLWYRVGASHADVYSWPILRSWDLRVVVVVHEPDAEVTVERRVAGVLVERVTGAGTLTLGADVDTASNPRDEGLTEIVSIEADLAGRTSGLGYTLTISRARPIVGCPSSTVAGVVPFGVRCDGRLVDGWLGNRMWGPKPDEYRWWSTAQDETRQTFEVPAGRVVTARGTVEGHSVHVLLTGPDVASSTTLRPNGSAPFAVKMFLPEPGTVTLRVVPFQPDATFRTIHHPAQCGEIGCTPAWTERYTTDQWDARSTGPMRFSLVLAHEPDAPPVAAAGADQSVVAHHGDARVSLDGGASTDDFRVAAWTWRVAGEVVAEGRQAVAALGVGTHTVELTARDDVGQTSTDTLVVNVRPNEPPLADAGPDLVRQDHDGTGGEAVLLSAHRSTDSGPTMAFDWSVGGATIATGSFAMPTLPVGETEVLLTATDAGGLTDTDDVRVTVLPNDPPTASAGPDVTVVDEDRDGAATVRLDASASRDTGPTLSYRWSLSGAPLSTARTPWLSFPVGEHDVLLAVTDAGGLVAEDTVRVTVVAPPPNLPPVARILVNCLLNECAFDARASTDADGLLQGYTWRVDGAQVSTASRARALMTPGAHTLSLVVRDDDGALGETSVPVLIEAATLAPPAVPPAQPVSREPGGFADAGDVLRGSADVRSAWMDVSLDEVAVAVHVPDLGAPGPGGAEMRYRVDFWSWGTRLRTVAAMGPDGAPAFRVEREDGSLVVVPRGSWDEETGIVWWAMPRAAVSATDPATSFNLFHGQAWTYAGGSGVRVDTTAQVASPFPRPAWP